MSLGQGLVGEQPSLKQMQSVLSEWDAYMYCGHGANLKNVPLKVDIFFQHFGAKEPFGLKQLRFRQILGRYLVKKIVIFSNPLCYTELQ